MIIVHGRWLQSLCVLVALLGSTALAAERSADTMPRDETIAAYFRQETAKLREACLADIETLDVWISRREKLRRRLFDMLGLDPLPQRTDLHVAVTGTVEEDDFVVEKIHFQSQPHLYVTANLYRPKNLSKPAPAILYACGHGPVKKNGVSYGNKVYYQHHGAWFARNGYVCLVIDSLQLGEIPGVHRFTLNLDRWWWINRGYTPAGVEAWNCIRALDYLESRDDVDPERIGVTGRSGGGGYSWWLAALDERIKCVVPVAGITDLQNQVVDGCCAEDYCDCMHMVNTFRWDYPLVAALVAPRALLISNSDRDRFFPLDGVVRLHAKVRKIYELYGARENLGLQITAGPHADTQQLRIHAFRWFGRHLKEDTSLVDKTATKFFSPQQLRVFDKLPESEINSKIAETFVPAATIPDVPQSLAEWSARRDAVRQKLDEYVFRGWPSDPQELDVKEAFSAVDNNIVLSAYDFTSQHGVRLRLYTARPAGEKTPPGLVVLNVLDKDAWSEFLATMRPGFEQQLQGETLPPGNAASYQQLQQKFENSDLAMAYVAPRAVAPAAWNQDERARRQIRRYFFLLGQTLDAMQVWDTRRAIQTLRVLPDWKETPLWVQSEGRMAGNALYASLYEPDIVRLDLYRLPHNHRAGPIYLNVARFLTMPESVALAAERSRVVIFQDGERGWEYPAAVAEQLGWGEKRLQLRQLPRE